MVLNGSRKGFSQHVARLASLLQKKKQSSRAAKRSRLFMESLESRTLLASDVYVNDNWNLVVDNDLSTTITAGDTVDAANDGGTPAGSFTFGSNAFSTIQDGINAVDVDGTVHVVAGTYAESPTINKSLVLESVSGKAVTTIQLQSSSSNYLDSLYLTGPGNNITVDGFTILGFDGTPSLTASTNIYLDPGLGDVTISNNELRVGAIDGGSSTGDDGFGFITTYSPGNPVDSLVVTGNVITPLNSEAQRAFYINPDVTQFTFSDNEVTGNFVGTAISQAFNSTISDNVITGVGAAGSRSGGIGVWGDPNPDAGYGTASITGNTFDNSRGVRIYDTKIATVSNNFFVNTDNGVTLYDLGYGVTDISGIHVNNNSFEGTYGFAIDNTAYANPVDAQTNWFGTNNAAAITALVTGNVDYSPWLHAGTDTSGAAGFQGDFSWLHVGTGGAQIGPTGRIQEGVNLVTAAGTVSVGAGTFIEDVNLNKTVDLVGAGAASTTISGAIGGAGSTIAINANNVLVEGFHVTRQGNNTTDWNSALNTAGLSIQGSFTGAEILNNRFDGNRSGIDINNSSGHWIHNNEIEDNRTGMIFRNQTNNINVENNSISDNWTVGVLFLDGSGGSNSPLQQAVGSVFTNNDLSGNWYGQIVDRQSGGSIPAPGTNLKNFSGNWFGTNAPVVTTANSTEPGYAALIPVAFGGSSVAPGGQPDILGPASANFDYSPWLDSGTDTSPTFGFQGDFSSLHVAAASAQVGATGRIQEAVNLVTVGGTIEAADGTYIENVSINKNLTLVSENGRGATTIQGVSGVGSLGAIVITPGTTDVNIGGASGNGFHIIGIDNNTPGIENAAVYIQGAQSGTDIRYNNIEANGDHGLASEYGLSLTNFIIDNNIFSGQTFVGANPAGNGFAAQFSLANVPRQLVAMSPNANSSGLVFSNNQITGVAGGISLTDDSGAPLAAHEQGNTLVTIDANGASITSNTFEGSTNRYGTSLRARGASTTISGNDFDSTGLSSSAGQVYIKNIGVDTAAVALANTFDKGAFVNGVDATIYHDFAALVSVIPAINVNIPVSVLEGTYSGNVDSTLANRVVTISPYSAVATGVTVTISGSLSVNAGDTLAFDLNGPTAGATYDQLVVGGAVSLGGATLSLNNTFAPTLGSTFTLIDGTSISGTFAGLPEGAIVSSSGYSFSVSYLGNDVTLTTVLTPTSVSGTGGDDTFIFDYLGATTAVTVNGVPFGTVPSGAFAVDGLGGTNTVIVNGTTAADTLSVGTSTIGVGALNVTVTNVQIRVANGDLGNDTFNISGTAAGATLNGGDDDDLFVFANGGSIGGSVNGGNGINTLNYSAYDNVSPVTVNLGSGIGTGVSGFTAIRNVFGGAGNDTLTGDTNANVIYGNAGNDIINGNTNNDTLSGGADNDTITGGGGTDTLIEEGDVNFTLTNTSLTGLGTDSLSGITLAVLTGGASNNTFTVSGWTGSVTLNGAGGTGDSVVAAKTGTSPSNPNFTLTDSSLVTTGASPLNATLNSIEDATLTGSSGVNTFTVSGWSGTGSINGGAANDIIVASNGGDMTLTATSLARTGRGTLSLSVVEVANLTGDSGANNFDVSGWLKPGSITGNGGSDTITATKNKNFTLTNSSLVTTDSMNLTLSGISNAVLTGGASANTFTVSGWTGTGTITGDAGNDIIAAVKNTNFVLTNTSLQTTDSMSLVLASVEVAKLTGGAGNNNFNFDGWTSSIASTVVGGGGTDTFEVARDGDFTMTNTNVTVKVASTTVVNATLTNVAVRELTGGASANTFTASAFGQAGLSATFDGQGGNDTVVKTTDTNFVLTDSLLTATDNANIALVSIDIAKITGGAGNNTLDVSGWTKTGLVSGSSGTDKVVVSKNADITISTTVVFASDGLSMSTSSIEETELTGGAGDNHLDANGFGGPATLWGMGGNDILIGGSGISTLNGGTGRDLLIGGLGVDTLHGNEGDDILIGAKTNYGSNFVALDKIMAEWTSGNSFATRISNIKAGTGLTAGTVLNTPNILDDGGATDILDGDDDSDWAFERTDTLLDLEFVDSY